MYIKVGALLTFITFIELVVLPEVLEKVGIPALPYTAVAILLLALSIAKLIFVLGIFMHLKDDQKIYSFLFLSPMIIAVVMICVLMIMVEGHFNYPKMAHAALLTKAGSIDAPVAWSEEEFQNQYTSQKADSYAKGKAVYESFCAGCHRIDGGGGIGPAMTDDCYIHGGTFKEIESVLINGVAEKGMPMWGPVLDEDNQLRNVVLYVRSLHADKVKNPKACEGEKYIKP
jgi:mono/diheme cytochrome c family protein